METHRSRALAKTENETHGGAQINDITQTIAGNESILEFQLRTFESRALSSTQSTPISSVIDDLSFRFCRKSNWSLHDENL